MGRATEIIHLVRTGDTKKELYSYIDPVKAKKQIKEDKKNDNKNVKYSDL
ncbi:hypothetical protein [Candidatus Francisella endociliophora]|nr:hypothetical protein [Francisella sp. FSC1006]